MWKQSLMNVILLKFDPNHRFFSPCDLWPWKTIGHLFYTTSSFVHHFKSIGELKLKLQPGNAQFGSKSAIFVPCDLEIWWMTLENNRAPLLYYIKLYTSFQSHEWIQTGVTVQKRSIQAKISNFLHRVTLKNNRAPLLCCFKLCASFHSHQWIQTRVIVRKRKIWVKIDDFFSRVTLKFDGRPWKTIGHLF